MAIGDYRPSCPLSLADSGGKTYDWRLRKAAWHFIANNDVSSAYKEVNKCRKIAKADGTWRYSLAFLEAYMGRLDRSINAYNKAFTRPAAEGISFEIEEFICWALKKNPNVYQLHFCLGYLNYKLKSDIESAKKDFEAFVGNSKASNDFPDQVRLAQIYLKEIEKMLEK